MGLLYLRLTLPGHRLWEWFEDLLEDEDEIQAKRQGPPMYGLRLSLIYIYIYILTLPLQENRSYGARITNRLEVVRRCVTETSGWRCEATRGSAP